MSALAILILVCVATCVLFAIGVYRCSREFSLQRRIEELTTTPKVETIEEEMKKPFMQRVVLPVAEATAKRVRNFMPKQAVAASRSRLIMAGLHPGMNEMHFLGICWLMAFLFLFLSVFVSSSLFHAAAIVQVIVAVVSFFAGLLLPQAVLNSQIRKRQDEIMVSFPYALDLLAICVEAGLGFDSALGYVMKKTHGPLADEFAKTLNEVRLGKPRVDALVDLSSRIGVEDVRSFITAIVHVNKMGGSIVDSLRVQADMVRVKRRHRAQEKVMKAPIKMVFPLVFCILPALFVVILCPALIAIIKEIVRR
jgi:tight adherence protein C